jgi:hypothetical protein
MYGNMSYVVRVVFNRLYLFSRVVVENPQKSVVGTNDDPLLARDKLGRTHRRVCDF